MFQVKDTTCRHEKFPSWPATTTAGTTTKSNGMSATAARKSWAEDQTNSYPKEQPPPIVRPYPKRLSNGLYTQQVNTVLLFYSSATANTNKMCYNRAHYCIVNRCVLIERFSPCDRAMIRDNRGGIWRSRILRTFVANIAITYNCVYIISDFYLPHRVSAYNILISFFVLLNE